MCTVLLPPGDNPIAVNKYIISYLPNDKQQDGSSTNVFLRFLLLVILNGLTWQVKFRTEVNCHIFTHDMQNNCTLNYLNTTQCNSLSVTVIFSVSK